MPRSAIERASANGGRGSSWARRQARTAGAEDSVHRPVATSSASSSSRAPSARRRTPSAAAPSRPGDQRHDPRAGRRSAERSRPESPSSVTSTTISPRVAVRLPPTRATPASAARSSSPSYRPSTQPKRHVGRKAEAHRRVSCDAAHRGDVGEVDRQRLAPEEARRALSRWKWTPSTRLSVVTSVRGAVSSAAASSPTPTGTPVAVGMRPCRWRSSAFSPISPSVLETGRVKVRLSALSCGGCPEPGHQVGVLSRASGFLDAEACSPRGESDPLRKDVGSRLPYPSRARQRRRASMQRQPQVQRVLPGSRRELVHQTNHSVG